VMSDPEALEPPAAPRPATSTAASGAPGRRLWPIALAAGVLAGAVIAGLVIVWVRGSTPPPGVPSRVRGDAAACAPPSCERVGGVVRLTWSRVDGANAIRVLRDDVDVSGPLPSTASAFTDRAAPIGSEVVYTVVADAPDGSVASRPLRLDVPTPPVTAAGLGGGYAVQVTVRRARNMASLFGIDAPVPGEVATIRWTFTSSCPPDLGACPARWGRSAGQLDPRGGTWVGTLAGPAATCPNGSQTAAPVRMQLRPTSGVVDAGWWVGHFTGRATVRFTCPGVAPSRGVVTVVGRRR
jgi:hypothetical protein